jgi:aryl-alcohol dehydrogenase-like predicted oxidoreductase
MNLPRYGLGTSRIASLGSALKQDQANALIDTALAAGVIGIDTADAYGSGDSERMIGKAIAGRRSDFFVMTKGGLPHVAFPEVLSPLNQVAKKVRQTLGASQNFSKNYLVRCAQKSLQRLKTSYLDVFFLHEPEGLLPDEAFEALAEIRKAGLSRYTGISTNSVEILGPALASRQIQVVQTPISYGAEADSLTSLCEAVSVPVVANQVLSGREYLQKHSKGWLRLRAEFNLNQISDERLLIAYASKRPSVSTVLFGTSSQQHLIENSQALPPQLDFETLTTQMKRLLS